MDAAKLNADGLQPLRPELARIAAAAAAGTAALVRVLARLHTIGCDPLFSTNVDQDLWAGCGIWDCGAPGRVARMPAVSSNR